MAITALLNALEKLSTDNLTTIKQRIETLLEQRFDTRPMVGRKVHWEKNGVDYVGIITRVNSQTVSAKQLTPAPTGRSSGGWRLGYGSFTVEGVERKVQPQPQKRQAQTAKPETAIPDAW